MQRTLHHAIAALLLASAATAAQAAPFAIQQSGSIAFTQLPGVNVGDGYTVTLIFDNGGTSAASQTWGTAHLTCALWTVDGGGPIAYTHPISPSLNNFVANGSATTGANGALTGLYTVVLGATHAGQFTQTGTTTLVPIVQWNINSANPVFQDSSGTGNPLRELSATGGGVSVAPAAWTAPQRVTGPCDPTPYAAPPAPNATPVPTLGHGALALLTCALGVAGLTRRRQRG